MTTGKVLKGKSFVAFCVFGLICAPLCAAEVTWVGGASGCWTNAANWSTGAVPPNNSTLVFNGDAVVDCRGITMNQTKGFKVTSGHVVVTSYGENPTLYIASTSYTVDVAKYSSCIISNGMYTYYGGTVFTKSGEGLFEVAGYFDNGKAIRLLKVNAGEFRLASNGASVNYGPLTNNVAAGATLTFRGPTSFARYSFLSLPATATLNILNGASTSFLNISGGGDIVVEDKVAEMTLGNMACDEPFTGTITGPLRIVFSDAAAAAGEGRRRFAVQRADQLADVVSIRSPGGIGFKAGIGTFYLPPLDGYYGDKGAVYLQDEDGAPVTVYAGMANAAGVAIAGPGNLFVTNTVNQQGAAKYTATGTFGTAGAGLYKFASGFDLTKAGATISGVVAEGGTLEFAGGTDVEVPLRGTAKKTFFETPARITDIDMVVTNLALGAVGNSRYEFAGGEVVVVADIRNAGGTNVFSGVTFSGPLASNTYDTSTALLRRTGVDFNGNNGTASIEVRGGDVWYKGGYGNRHILLTGGRTHFFSNFSSYPNNGATILFDGGEAVLEATGSSFEFQPNSSYYSRMVGARGGRFSIGRNTGTYSAKPGVYFYNPYATAPGVAQDGGIELRGNANWRFFKPLAINGPVSLLDGFLFPRPEALATSSVLYGTGDFRIRDAIFDLTPDLANSYSASIQLATGTGSALVYDGAACIRFRTTEQKAYQSVSAGGLRRAGKGSVLVLKELNGAGGVSMIGAEGGDMLTVAGKAATAFVREPVVLSDSSMYGNYFAKYDATRGFQAKPDAECANSYAGADAVAYIAANTTLSTDACAAAVKLGNFIRTTIKPDVTLTLGNGVDPALVLFMTGGGFVGTGTLDFGAGEGVFYAGYSSDVNEHVVECKVSGSGGVSYVAYPDYVGVDRVVAVSGANDYTGGTYLRACVVKPRNVLAFSTGDVHVGSGHYSGGCVTFDRAVTLANNFHLAGWGYGGSGTLLFATNATISGSVEVVEEARVRAANGVVGTLSGTVSGDRLVVYGSPSGAGLTGEIALRGANVHTGGTEVVRSILSIADGRALGYGDVLLDKGVLRCANDTDIVVTNTVAGVGTVRLSGSGKVSFGRLDSQRGEGFTLDLAARKVKIATLDGFSAITATTRPGQKVDLVVTDDEEGSWTGALPEKVTLHYCADLPDKGTVFIVR